MRTKALILTAALGAMSVASSMAQVYSVNAVGYVNLPIQNGFNLVANQFTSANTTLGAILPSPNPGTTVYKLVSGAYVIYAFDPDDLVWLPNPNLSVAPGEGVFVFNPGSTFTWTLLGEVPQGNLSTPLVSGFSMVSSQVPQAGTVSSLGLVGQPGYTIYRYANNGAGGGAYAVSSFDPDDLVWLPTEPSLSVGEAAFLFNPGAAGSWVRNFTVN